MAGLDERLNQLLNNQEGAKSALELMQALLQKQEPSSQTEGSAFESASPLPETNASDTGNQTLSALAMLLPQFLQAMSGDADLINQDRAALVKALRPYLKEGRLPSIERALRLANMAKAATSAMKHLGR